MVIFYELIYRPLYNLLVFFYDIIPGADFGIAIIFVTVLIKVILMPLSKKQIEQQKKMQEIQPKIKEVQEKHKDNKEKQMAEMMALYKENKANPFSGCLPLIIQLIFLIAFYRILFNITDANLLVNADDLYSFVSNPGEINKMFLGIVDLSKPSYVIAVLAAIGQYFQTKMMMNKKDKEDSKKDKKDKSDLTTANISDIMSKQMMYLLPIITLVFGLQFAAGLAIYWLASIVFAIIQQIYVFKKDNATK